MDFWCNIWLYLCTGAQASSQIHVVIVGADRFQIVVSQNNIIDVGDPVANPIRVVGGYVSLFGQTLFYLNIQMKSLWKRVELRMFELPLMQQYTRCQHDFLVGLVCCGPSFPHQVNRFHCRQTLKTCCTLKHKKINIISICYTKEHII